MSKIFDEGFDPVENFRANHSCHSKINIHSTQEKEQNRVKRSKGEGRGSDAGGIESLHVMGG
jgi:hypothetical protein